MTRKRYWVIAPADSTQAEVFDKAWEYDLMHGTIAVGWRELADASGLSRAELEARFQNVYGDLISRDINAIWRFYHELSPGDVIIARRGTKKIIGIGEVAGRAFYDEARGRERVGHLTEYHYPNFVPVKWEQKLIDFDRIVFSFYVMYEIAEEKYRSLLEGVSDAEEISEQSKEFVLEKYLEDFIVTNFSTIFAGELEPYRDDEAGHGQQYPTEVGNIDILAKEPATGSYVVIELKKGNPSDKVVGQILRYMGWVAENLCEPGQGVKGLIICRDYEERLHYALRLVEDAISVRLYEVDFRLKGLSAGRDP